MTTSIHFQALKFAGIALFSVIAAACDESRGAGGTDANEDVAEAPEAQTAPAEAPAVDGAAVELERLLRRVERGDVTKADVAALSELVAAAKLPSDELDRASLALSKALEAQGDAEGAIRELEVLLKRHNANAKFDLHDEVRARLRLLVAGSEDEPVSYAQNMEPMAPIAKALVPFFPEDDRGLTLQDVLSVGQPPTANDPHGVFNLRAAKRVIEEGQCSVCDIDIKVNRSHSRVDSWLAIPLQAGERRAEMPNPDRSMVVVYFDLVQNRVPSRYDAYLALPSAETVARLERGEAFVAVRERKGKKPLVLLAAPRAGQLDVVEAAFAEMTTIPTEPVTVDVQKKLFPHEIQSIVRSGFKGFRACYEKLLVTDPKAEGEVKVKFSIDGEGVVRGVSTTSTLSDAAVGTCVADGMSKLRFPATGAKIDVTYPIAFSPG